MRNSGANVADIIVRATEEYKLKHGRDKFGYEHVWAICKDLPSWQPSFVARQASLSKSSTNQTSSATVGGSVEGSGGGSSQGNEGGSEKVFPRPMERNAEMFERHLQMKLERDQRKEEELRIQQYNILMKDTSEMTEDQLATHLAYSIFPNLWGKGFAVDGISAILPPCGLNVKATLSSSTIFLNMNSMPSWGIGKRTDSIHVISLQSSFVNPSSGKSSFMVERSVLESPRKRAINVALMVLSPGCVVLLATPSERRMKRFLSSWLETRWWP
nr:glutathione S-transferase T3-like [Ipomoea batatas]